MANTKCGSRTPEVALPFAERIVAAIKPDRFGVQEVYPFGSTEAGNAGVGSDFDLIIVSAGSERQRRDLEMWLEGWSLCLAEVSFQLYGVPSRGLLDIGFFDPERAKTEIPSFMAAGSTMQLLPVGTVASVRGPKTTSPHCPNGSQNHHDYIWYVTFWSQDFAKSGW